MSRTARFTHLAIHNIKTSSTDQESSFVQFMTPQVDIVAYKKMMFTLKLKPNIYRLKRHQGILCATESR